MSRQIASPRPRWRRTILTTLLLFLMAAPAHAFSNNDFEIDPAGTPGSGITWWTFDFYTHNDYGTRGTNPQSEHELKISDARAFSGSKSVYSFIRNRLGGGGGDTDTRHSTHDLVIKSPYHAVADSSTLHLWRTEVDYTTSSRWYWRLMVELSDGETTEVAILACRCWGNSEGCAGNYQDTHDQEATGTDGTTWYRHPIPIPAGMNRSNLTVRILHSQDSWDGTTAESTLYYDLIGDFELGAPVRLARTGQTTSSAPGDDGSLRTGVPWPDPRFANPDGTTPISGDVVVDRLTGLMWTRDVNSPGPDDCGPGTWRSWQGALNHVACLNEKRYLGYGDWRLPNRKEMESLVDYEQPDVVSWLASSGFLNVIAFRYWTATSHPGNAAYGFIVYLGQGGALPFSKEEGYPFWPVRTWGVGTANPPVTGQLACYNAGGGMIPCAGTGQEGETRPGSAWPDPRFRDNGDETVTDDLTGLMWTKDGSTPGPPACGPGTLKTWQEALDYVRCLNTEGYLGYGDWRLPNLNELESLTHAGVPSTPAWLNGSGFTNVPVGYATESHYWSSTTIAGAPAYAWIVSLEDGLIWSFDSPKSSAFNAWPVRAGLAMPIPAAGLRLWLKADVGLSKDGAGRVDSWADQSGNGLDVSQADLAGKPLFSGTGIGGKPALAFDGTDFLSRPSVAGTSLFSNTADALFIVLNQPGTNACHTPFSWAASPWVRFLAHAACVNFLYFQVGDPQAGGMSQAWQPTDWADLPHVLTMVRDGNAGEIRVDGVSLPLTIQFSTPGDNSGTAALNIGKDDLGGNFFVGDIAEVIVYDNALTTEERLAVEAYLGAKYGIDVTPPGADLSIVKTDAPDPVVAGATLTYTLTVTNAGPDNATAVTVTDTLPAGGTLVSASGTGWSCGASGGVVTCTMATFPVGTAPVITILVTAPAEGGILSNSATVSAAEPDPDPNNNSSTATTTVTPSADLSIVKNDSPDPVVSGQTLTYTLTVNNAGPSTATGVTVTDTLPGGVTHNSASGTGWSCNHSGGVVTCTMATFPVGTAPDITIQGTAPSVETVLTNTATVTATEEDPNPADNTATATTAVNLPSYTITATVSGGNGQLSCDSPVKHGSSSVCTITPDPGYVLKWLTEDGVRKSVPGNTYTVAGVTGPHTVVAAFSQFLVSPEEGTYGTVLTITGAGFGVKKGKVLLNTTALKVTDWNDTVIHALVKKILQPGAHDVSVVTKTKGVPPLTVTDCFTVKTPEIDPVPGQAGPSITITGKFFGTKKGKIYVDGKKAKVTVWNMESDSGESTATFIPPKGTVPGQHELYVTGKASSSDPVPFTITP